MAKETKHGGVRKNSGRPRGKKNAATLEREKVAEAYRQRVLRLADRILDKQLVLANGQQFLYRIDKIWKTPPSGKGGWWVNKKPKLVTNPDEISAYLNGDYEDANEDDGGGSSYYYITTKEPSGSVLDSMLDRAIGSATKSLELSNPDGTLKQIIIIKHGDGKRK